MIAPLAYFAFSALIYLLIIRGRGELSALAKRCPDCGGELEHICGLGACTDFCNRCRKVLP